MFAHSDQRFEIASNIFIIKMKIIYTHINISLNRIFLLNLKTRIISLYKLQDKTYKLKEYVSPFFIQTFVNNQPKTEILIPNPTINNNKLNEADGVFRITDFNINIVENELQNKVKTKS